MLPFAFAALPFLLTQPAPAWSVAFDPSTPGAVGVHWTISVSAPYCGGYRIGDGVYIQPEAPLALPDTISANSVLFAGQAADVALQDGVLHVTPSPGGAQSMLCQQGQRRLTVELLPSLGLTNPEAGLYTVDVWIGSGGAPVPLPITIADTAASSVQAPATLDGQVLLGPTCPVVRLDNPGACADRPYQAALLIQALGQPGASPTRVDTDTSGAFSVQLDPGTYAIVPELAAGSSFPRGTPLTLTLAPDDHQTITVHLDTGIR